MRWERQGVEWQGIRNAIVVVGKRERELGEEEEEEEKVSCEWRRVWRMDITPRWWWRVV